MKYIIGAIVCLLSLMGCDSTCDCEDDSGNHPPVISEILASPPTSTITNGSAQPVVVTAVAIDDDGDRVTYHWSSSAGEIETGLSAYSTTTNPGRWNPPNEPGTYEVKCTVSDGKEAISKTITLEVVQ